MLDKELLQKEVRKLNDSSYEEFEGFPSSCSLACIAWSECVYEFSKNIAPYSSSAAAAKATMASSLTGICSSTSFNQSVAILENSIIAYANSLGGGMVASNFWHILSTEPLNLRPILLEGQNGGSAINFASKFSKRLDEWFKKCLAVEISSGAVINWN